MTPPSSSACGGPGILQALKAAAGTLQRQAGDVDALNVFPVPDGDTGSNMSATMLAACHAAAEAGDACPGEVLRRAARGALTGARGNSGVILSQALRGLAEGVGDGSTLEGQALAQGFACASRTADAAMARPVEGTILTVLREAARGAEAAARAGRDARGVLGAALDSAREALWRTPDQLELLRQAGVVDAGGRGLTLLLEGACRWTLGEPVPELELAQPSAPSPMAAPAGPRRYGYCTSYLLLGQGLQARRILGELERIGDSALAVGDPSMLKVHVHTQRPGDALNIGCAVGTLADVKVDDIDEQHRDYQARQENSGRETAGVGTVAVVAGDGMRRIFESLGVAAVVPGGQTMNPSTEEIARAVRSLPQAQAIVLPNNENVVLTARHAGSLCGKQVAVVPTTTMPQGLAAMLAFNREQDLETNLRLMERARRGVRTIELTRATRSATVGGVTAAKGQVLALVDGTMVAAADDAQGALREALARLPAADYELATVYFGEGVQRQSADAMADDLRQGTLGVQVEVQEGGQPHYDFIVSLE